MNENEKAEFEKSLQERDDLRAILASMSEGVLVIDRSMGVRMMNVAAGVLLRVAPADAIGKHVDTIFTYYRREKSGEVRGNFVQKAIERTNIVKVTFHDDYYCKNLSGGEFPVGMVVSTLLKDGKNSGAIVVFEDVTAEKRVDEAKSEFVALAAHQLRTPLASINWYAEMLLAGDAGHLKDKQRTYLDQVYRAGRRMAELVRALLNVSRIELGSFVAEPQSVDIPEIAKTVLGELTGQIKMKNIHVEERFDESARTMMADPQLLLIILQNLLTNAVKYTPENGTIAVEISADIREGGTLIKVADSGLGIPEGEQDKIFTKLYRAHNVKNLKGADGTGLGLYIIKSIIHEVGGSIRFESFENTGTTFFVTFPKEGMLRREGTKRLS